MSALLVINPSAGAIAEMRLRAALRETRLDSLPIEVSRSAEEGARVAREAAERGHDPVVAVGGDGTVNSIVNGLMAVPVSERPALGIMPAGSGNDLARTLGIPKQFTASLRWLARPGGDRIDIGRCNTRWFANVGGTGLDTEVARSLSHATGWLSHGQLGYLVHGVRELARYRNPEIRIEIDGERIVTRSLLMAVGNGRYYAGGMKICPDADPADGRFDVCIAGDLSRWEAAGQIPMIYLGRHVRHPKVCVLRATEVRVEGPAGMAVQLDGDVLETLPATFRVEPQALRVAGWSVTRR